MKIDIRDRNTQIGLGLLGVGLLALFGNLGLFAGLGRLLGLAMFVGAGVLVLRAFGDDPRRVWVLPIGFGLIGLGLATLDLAWSGGAFLGALGLGFLAIFLRRRDQWWAIIPGGVLLTLGVTASYDEWLRPGGDAGGTVFFLGLAATFAALYLLPSVSQRWAIWPALALAVIGVLTIDYRGGWVLPAILIGVGVWMLSRQYRPAEVPPSRPGGGDAPTVDAAPGPRPGAGPAATPPAATDASAGTTPRVGAYDRSPADDAGVRTTAQTPSSAAVQPSAHPEAPEEAARREVREEATIAGLEEERPADPSPADPAAADVPPYGQEPAGRAGGETPAHAPRDDEERDRRGG